MSQRDEDFMQVLSRLQAVRDELSTTTSPERVGVLRSSADQLVADGERLLGVHLGTPAQAVEPAESADGAAAAVEPPVQGPPTADTGVLEAPQPR